MIFSPPVLMALQWFSSWYKLVSHFATALLTLLNSDLSLYFAINWREMRQYPSYPYCSAVTRHLIPLWKDGGHAIQIQVRVFWAKENLMSSVLDIDILSTCNKSSIFHLIKLLEWASLRPKYKHWDDDYHFHPQNIFGNIHLCKSLSIDVY